MPKYQQKEVSTSFISATLLSFVIISIRMSYEAITLQSNKISSIYNTNFLAQHIDNPFIIIYYLL